MGEGKDHKRKKAMRPNARMDRSRLSWRTRSTRHEKRLAKHAKESKLKEITDTALLYP